jgi:cytochrome P450
MIGNLVAVLASPIIVYLVFFFYKFIYIPYTFDKHFRKYKNVYLDTKSFTPLIGDVSVIKKVVANGGSPFMIMEEFANKSPTSDYLLLHMGVQQILSVVNPECSMKLAREIPNKLDKFDDE